MRNPIRSLDDGNENPAFGARIQNLMIFQYTGWTGLPRENGGLSNDSPPRRIDVAWPLCGGVSAYLSKSRQVYVRQMEEIRTLNLNTAVSVLIMPEDENRASGFKACWNGISNDGRECQRGEWKTPHDLYPEILRAAQARGVPVVPEISIMGWNNEGVAWRPPVDRLRDMVDFLMRHLSAANLRTEDGRVVMVLEGMPAALYRPGLDPARDREEIERQKEINIQELVQYMGSRSDVYWLNILAADPNHPERFPLNVAHWTWGSEQEQGWWRDSFGARHTYHFRMRDIARSRAEASDPSFNLSESLRRKFLNIEPADSEHFPIVISQYNEFGEFHVFEPNDFDRYRSYDFLRSLLAQQPGSHPGNAESSLAALHVACGFTSPASAPEAQAPSPTASPTPSDQQIAMTLTLNGQAIASDPRNPTVIRIDPSALREYEWRCVGPCASQVRADMYIGSECRPPVAGENYVDWLSSASGQRSWPFNPLMMGRCQSLRESTRDEVGREHVQYFYYRFMPSDQTVSSVALEQRLLLNGLAGGENPDQPTLVSIRDGDTRTYSWSCEGDCASSIARVINAPDCRPPTSADTLVEWMGSPHGSREFAFNPATMGQCQAIRRRTVTGSGEVHYRYFYFRFIPR